MNTVFFAIDSHWDFLYPSGALYVPGAERVVPAIAGLNRWAAGQGIAVVSTADAHTENDPEFLTWPHHCVAGTLGQHKAEATLLEKRVVIPNRPCDVSVQGAQQIVLEKQQINMFTAVNWMRVLDELNPRHCIVYGVVTEFCVWHAAVGLLKSGRAVTVVTDAIKSLSDNASATALAGIVAAGGKLATAAEIGAPR